MSNWWDDITRRLAQIREESGVPPRGVRIIPRALAEVDEEVSGKFIIDEICDFDETGLLLRNGKPVLIYIPDNTFWSCFENFPRTLNKLHFTACDQLRRMSEEGKLKRYHCTNRVGDRYPIDLRNRKDRPEVRLYPCQYCLSQIDYQGFYRNRDKGIVRNFSATDAMLKIREVLESFRPWTEGLPPDSQPAGYPPDFDNISRKYREKRGFVCEKFKRSKERREVRGCGVNLSATKEHQKLAHAHHMDYIKYLCDDEDLCCLCKECHQKQHKHDIGVTPEESATIRRLRAEQGITI